MPRNDANLPASDKRPPAADAGSAPRLPADGGLAGPLGRGSIPVRVAARARPREVAFLLIPGFALLAYACAMEPYRAANVLAGRALYRWRHVSPTGRPVEASNGVPIVPDQGIDRPLDVDDLFVCAGGNPALFDDPATLAWLRAQAHRGVRVGGISGGPYVLARAGLLDGYRCTLHWEYRPALVEAFPRLAPTGSVFEIDRDRCTASGGTAALDMMAALIAAEHGRPLAAAVSEWFLHTRVRSSAEPQRMSLRERYDVGHPVLLAVLARMEGAIEEPAPRAELARLAGLSVRQLERLFRAYLGRTIGGHYRALRLDRARMLLSQTALSVLEVSLACGFASAAHFSRAFRARFGHPPRAERGGRVSGRRRG